MSTEPQNDSKEAAKAVAVPEREFEGSIWKHPYMVYVWLSVIPFIILLVAGYLAIKGGWLPNASP